MVRFILYLFTCGPVVLMFAAWITVWVRRKRERTTFLGAIALAIATANAVLAAGTVLYHDVMPAPSLPPWKNPEILNLGLLFLSAPIGFVVAMWAVSRGAPRWLTWMIGLGSVQLTIVGLFASAAV